jgi:hypothetical protein
MKKLKLNEFNLTNEELNELKGGVFKSAVKADNDILNKNSYFNCKCDYKNMSLITNDNSVNGCNCNCTY